MILIPAEKDQDKKAGLTAKVAEYTKRAEELKSVLQPTRASKSPEVPANYEPVKVLVEPKPSVTDLSMPLQYKFN